MGQAVMERDERALTVEDPGSRQVTSTWQPEDAYTREQIDLIKSSYVQGELTDAEFVVFMQMAQRRGLDPLEGQITAVKRWNSRLKRETMQIQTTIDGSRLIAQNTGELAGIARPVWGPVVDGIPEWAEATVYRGKPGEPAATFTAVVWWDEFKQVDKEGGLTRFWKQMPRHMLYKVALSHALRSAFQKQLSGIYTDDEMAQADNPPRVVDERPAERIAPPQPRGPAPQPRGKGQQGKPSPTRERLEAIQRRLIALHEKYTDPGEYKLWTLDALGMTEAQLRSRSLNSGELVALENYVLDMEQGAQQQAPGGSTAVDENTAFTFNVEEQEQPQATPDIPDLADLPMARGGRH